MRASTTQDTGDASPVTGALAFTVVFGAAGVPPFGWTFVMPAVGVEGVGVVAEPVVPPAPVVVPFPVPPVVPPLPVPLPDPVALTTVKFAVAVPPFERISSVCIPSAKLSKNSFLKRTMVLPDANS